MRAIAPLHPGMCLFSLPVLAPAPFREGIRPAIPGPPAGAPWRGIAGNR